MKSRSKIVDNTLFVRDETGEYRIAPLGLVIERARTLLDEQAKTEAITSPDKARDWCMARLASLDHEVFGVVFLDNQHRVIAFEEMFRGTIDSASVWPREVVKATLKHNAAAVIFSHNHPSGLAEPSEADRHITRRLKDALAMIDVRVMDHIIVGGGQWYSFAQYGLL
jgi:DNA repair protein RadC